MADRQHPDAFENLNPVRKFSHELKIVFGLREDDPKMRLPIDPADLPRLRQAVDERKEDVASSIQELQKLEAELRDTNEQLARASQNNTPVRPTAQQLTSRTTPPPQMAGIAEKTSQPPRMDSVSNEYRSKDSQAERSQERTARWVSEARSMRTIG
ncbi:hypothetical protein LTR97_002095 [Elasticomyces elasticus]|uniref:Uncharacterized protein n=1 Tax=Elasticomyces elasticus TaxID=574655 RepID=A0AAN7ZVG3_9PEZI|nr:hypothetical protein LTR97_002095 [Elasticomyces elasticus]